MLAAKEGVEFVLPWSTKYATEALKVVWRFAQQKKIAITAVTDQSFELAGEGKPEGVKKIISCAANAPLGVVRELETTGYPKLLVFWEREQSKEESLEERKVVQRALDYSIEVRNLCDAITEIQSLEEKKIVPTEELTLYSAEDIDAMSGEDVTAIAVNFGMTVEEVEAANSWDDVRDKILELQDAYLAEQAADPVANGEEVAADPAMDEGEAAEGEVTPYTDAELEAMAAVKGYQQLKDILSAWGYDEAAVRSWSGMERPRADKYIALIKQLQSGDYEGAEESPAQTPSEEADAYVASETSSLPLTSNPNAAEVVYASTIQIPEPPDFSPIVDALHGGFMALSAKFDALIEAQKELASIYRQALSTPTTNGTAAPKAVAPPVKLPTKAAPTPAPVAAAAPPRVAPRPLPPRRPPAR